MDEFNRAQSQGKDFESPYSIDSICSYSSRTRSKVKTSTRGSLFHLREFGSISVIKKFFALK